MFYTDGKLQYEVRVDKPNPLFAKMLQQAIGGQEGEMRVCMQYMFQGWAMPVKMSKYRDLLLHTGTEEIGHIEMLATAVAKNLENAPLSLQEEMAAQNPMVESILGGMQPRQLLSAGLHAMPVDANGVPFTGGYIVASGNLAGDMYANVMAEATGRTLAARLYEMTDDPGMKDMLAFLIARDVMHQNQWLAVLEELGPDHLPIPNSFPQSEEKREFSYAFMSTRKDPKPDAFDGSRWVSGRSIDGNGEFSFIADMKPLGDIPKLGMADPRTFAQIDQIAPDASARQRLREEVAGHVHDGDD